MRLKNLTLRHEKRNLMKLFHPLHDYTYNAIRAEIWIELDEQTANVDDTSLQDFQPSLPKRSNTNTSNISHTLMPRSVSSQGNKSLRSPGYGAFPANRRLVIYCKAGHGVGNPQMQGADTIYSIKCK